jgi:hypothetical protein
MFTSHYYRERPLPALAAHPRAEGNPRQDPPGAGAQAAPAAAAFRTAVEREIPETRLAEVLLRPGDASRSGWGAECVGRLADKAN